jgi:stage II sporulation protein E
MYKWSGLEPWESRWAGWKLKAERAGRAITDNRLVKAIAARRGTFLIVAMAFLLGRAMILEELSPFALAFLAVIYHLRRDLVFLTGLSALAGAMLSMHPQLPAIAFGMALFLLIQKGLERFERSDISTAPLLVMFVTGMVRLFALMLSDQMHWYPLMLAGMEAVLGFVLTLIFIQAVPVLTMSRKKVQLRNEEVICLIILLASVMTGMVGWSVEELSVEHIMSRYLILVFAIVGGAPLGASVGVITGLILSLADITAIYQISLLAFAGMLAGLMREAGRMGTAVGMLIGSTILSLYIGEQSAILSSTWESAVSVLAFMLTPRSLIKWTAQYVPGTKEHMNLQQDYAKRVREVTAGRVQQFSEVFRQLSKSFMGLTQQSEREASRERQTEHFMNAVAQRTCSNCPRQTKCWDTRFYHTHQWMTEMMSEIEAKPNLGRKAIKPEWRSACIKAEHVLNVMKQEYEQYKHNFHWKRQIAESRQLVAEQLSGVSQVMEDLAREIRREGQALHLQEEQIRLALEQLGLPINSIDIISLEEGKVEIEIVHPYRRGLDECRKIIAPLLSDILGENIAVKREEPSDERGGLYTVLFGSAKEYEVETGVAGAAKGGGLLSGDSFAAVELGNGKFAVALSDGMGNGERANAESKTALTILQQLLQSGMDEQLAVKSVNSVLLLRTPEEMFATIDVALIDQYTAQTTFLKNGSTPSFIKRGSEVITVSANGLPAGILQEIDVDISRVQLQPGDILIMMTDGLLDAPRHAVNKEVWMRRIIQELKVEDPQEIADCLLETAVRHHHGDILDDMTVVVARIERYQPEWSTFRWPGLTHFERPKIVS